METLIQELAQLRATLAERDKELAEVRKVFGPMRYALVDIGAALKLTEFEYEELPQKVGDALSTANARIAELEKDKARLDLILEAWRRVRATPFVNQYKSSEDWCGAYFDFEKTADAALAARKTEGQA